MKNFNKKLTLVVALASIVSCASANAQEQTSTLIERLASPISKFCLNITDIGIKGLTKFIMKISTSVDRCLPMDAQKQVDPRKMAEDLALLTFAAGTEAAKKTAETVDEALANNPETAEIAVSAITEKAMNSIQGRATVVVPKTIYEKTWFTRFVQGSALVGFLALTSMEKSHSRSQSNAYNNFFNRFLINFRR